MSRGEEVDDVIRRAIGGDEGAAALIVTQAEGTDATLVVVMAALLERDRTHLDRARSMALTSRERQVVEIARAHLDGRSDRVDELARDHLVDHPASLIVAWIATGAVRSGPREGP